MNAIKNSALIGSTGLAIFSMFFGAGNIIFPLALGQMTLDKNIYAVFGMIITAVIMPLLGLLAMFLYDGNYESFFSRIGKIPGFLVTLLILALLGPLGAIPRCIAISYSTLSVFGLDHVVGMNLWTFSLLSCLAIFLFAFRPNKILPLLGYVLTPVLLISLAIIVIKGSFLMPEAGNSMLSGWSTFSQGVIGGYNTMDLLASFFFSSVVLIYLKKNRMPLESKEKRISYKIAIFSSCIAAGLLAIVYIGFSFLAAGYSTVLEGVSSDLLLGTLSYQLLGPYAGLIAGIAVLFACITTEIALAAVFAEFLKGTLAKNKISYTSALWITIAVSFLISTLKFEGISAFLSPLLQICYPALIVLTFVNIFHKLYDFGPVKRLFYATIAISMIAYLVS